jgi:hypothetical protein
MLILKGSVALKPQLSVLLIIILISNLDLAGGWRFVVETPIPPSLAHDPDQSEGNNGLGGSFQPNVVTKLKPTAANKNKRSLFSEAR